VRIGGVACVEDPEVKVREGWRQVLPPILHEFIRAAPLPVVREAVAPPRRLRVRLSINFLALEEVCVFICFIQSLAFHLYFHLYFHLCFHSLIAMHISVVIVAYVFPHPW
jgi:hypothetical protein